MKKDEQEILSQKGAIEMEYIWPAGTSYERFLLALQDGKIIGSRCKECGTVSVPPWLFCESCGLPTQDWPEVSPRGVLRAYTIVRKPMMLQPLEPPYAVALIRLEGTDTDLIHIIRPEHLEGIKPGCEVEAVWADKDKRESDIFAILGFRPVKE
jgi:uncharacterized OB-fold protein